MAVINLGANNSIRSWKCLSFYYDAIFSLFLFHKSRIRYYFTSINEANFHDRRADYLYALVLNGIGCIIAGFLTGSFVFYSHIISVLCRMAHLFNNLYLAIYFPWILLTLDILFFNSYRIFPISKENKNKEVHSGFTKFIPTQPDTQTTSFKWGKGRRLDE
ncbi:hypothetical protein HZS_5182 [Henneguya salminicola]|nr:hypothetical protein HZS_5182 [Henneguya salminicola]